MPNSIATIGGGAFRDCKSLQSIDIPNSVTTIEEDAFYACESLQSIDIPNSVTTIGNCAFCGCSSLLSIDIPNSVTSIGRGVFCDCKSLLNIDISGNVISLVISIENNDFCGCESLQNINVIGDSPYYTSIDGILFSKDESAIIKFPEGKRLTEYKIPNNVIVIWEYAFRNCIFLQSIDIPNNTTRIGEYAFENCTALQHIHMHHKNIKDYFIYIEYNVFHGINFDECTLYVPSGSRWAYRHHPVFEEFKNIVTVKEL